MDYRTTPAQVQEDLAAMREANNGELPTFAWPGGYPMYYTAAPEGEFCRDVGEFCADCANGGPEPGMGDDDVIIGYAIHEEGPPLVCDGCGVEIESAYGDPDEESEQELTYADLKAEFKIDLRSDPYAHAMGVWNDVSEVLYFERDFPVPNSWGYRPSPLGRSSEDEDTLLCVDVSLVPTEGLLRFGNVLSRYIRMLEFYGRTY